MMRHDSIDRHHRVRAYKTLTDKEYVARTSWLKLEQGRVDKAGELAAARQELIKADQQLTVHTRGGVVNAGDPVLVIVPAGQKLEVDASVLNKDVGFVEAGQIVEVKLEAFPFTRYGAIHGEILHISRDTVEDEQQGLICPSKVAIDRQDITVDGREINLAAGMSATVEIKTGDRPIIEFLLAPLFRHRDEGLRER